MKFRWRIRHKLTAGLMLIVGMTAMLSAGSFYGLYAYRRSNKIFNYQHQQLERLGYLVLAVSELYFPSRDVISADVDEGAAKLEKLRRLERIETVLARYRDGLTSAVDAGFAWRTGDRQRFELDQMEKILNHFKSEVTGVAAVAIHAPGRRRSWFYTGSERDDIMSLINTLQRLRGHIHEEVTAHVDADANHYRASLAVVYSTSVLVLFMLVALVWLGYQAVFHPIRALHQGVVKLADGNFEFRVRLNSGDEMEELGEAFNGMADRLQGIYKDLNHQVEERSRQLIRSERLASVGFLAAGVAHEINNPLASIAFCGEALGSRLREFIQEGDENAEVVHSYLNMIQQEAFRCKAITEKLLNFSRVGEPERADADINGLIREVIELVQHLGRAQGRNVRFEPAEQVVARVHPQELKQVLLNLVVNALESVDDGGNVWIEASDDGYKVEIKVTDDGCGMTEEVLENLFEPFFTRNRTGKGTGLGLSISHLIISQHGGALEASSPGPGQGSAFRVRLPSQPKARRIAA